MKGKKSKKLISLLAIFLLISSLLPQFSPIVKADTTLPSIDTYAVLVGDLTSDLGLGTNWDQKNTKAIMKEYSKGIYELTVDFKATDANNATIQYPKTYNYKAAFNGQWDSPKALGDNGNNKAITVTAPGKITFKVDYSAGKVYDSINDPGQFKTAASLIGDFTANGGKSWDTTDQTYNLNYIGEGTYSKTFSLKAGKYQYKTEYNHAWNNGEVKDNVSFTLSQDQDVTFVANPDSGLCTDSVNTPSVSAAVSLIGDVRESLGSNSSDDWTVSAKGYEFSQLTNDGKFIFSKFLTEGTRGYKVLENYAWNNGSLPSGAGAANVSIVIPKGGAYVTFIADKKNKTIIDSINNAADVANILGLSAPESKLVSPSENANGTVTFSYKSDTAKAVYLAGTMNGWSQTATPLTKDSKGIWTTTLRLPDDAINGSYKFVADGQWITDPANATALDKDGNSTFSFDKYTGRKVVVAGDIQGVIPGQSSGWDPTSDITKMTYLGDGAYSLTLKNVKAGSYQYKAAMGSWDPENYGANGINHGSNISITIPKAEDVTFYYNDDSHIILDSTVYTPLDISLKGTGITSGTKLLNKYLTGVYSTKVTLTKGSYSDISAVYNGKEYSYGNISITDASKEVTFSFEPKTGTTFTDVSSKTIDTDSLYFNSRDENYKNPYGAVKLGDTITFNLQALKDDLTVAKLVVDAPDGTQVINLNKNGTFATDTTGKYDRWTCTYKPSSINMYKYYFVVSNGSDVKAYGDATGYYGPGKAGNIGTVGEYGFNVYDPSFKTPDWMKNAVVYQIFPDRFFNGDTSNDYAKKTARGTLKNEFISNWYSLPEDPNIEYASDSSGKILVDANGNKVIASNYKGNVGDGQWSNDLYGGDLKGIEQKLDYLKSLGVNTLYLNPISQSISNHKYDTTDYTHVDSTLGTDEDYAELTKAAAKKGFHIILDGVFNHVSDDSIYFDRYGKYVTAGKPLGAYQYWSKVYDLMNSNSGLTQQDAEKQVQSYFASIGITDFKYKDWFSISNTKIAATDGDPAHYDYTGWNGYDSMPIIQHLNGSEINIASWEKEIIDGSDSDVRTWLKNGANGWRLDAANVIADDVFPKLRQAAKEEGDNVIIGEIWDDASKYLLGNEFDSVTNYRFRGALLDLASGSGNTAKVTDELELIREEYPKEAFEAMLNIAGSHDVERVLSYLDGVDGNTKTYAPAASDTAKAKNKLVPLLQMTYAGAPCIYYGDEAGMVGGADPDNRRGMIWGEGDKDLVQWYATLANIRNAYPVLRTGDVVPETASGTDASSVLAFLRNDSTNNALVAINQKDSDVSNITISTGAIPEGTVLTNVLNPSEKYTVKNGAVTINVPKQSGDILVVNYTAVTINTDGLKDAYDSSYKVADRTDSDAITKIISAAANSVVTVSNTDGTVSKNVFDEAKAKSVIPQITRGNVTFKFGDASVFNTIDNAGGLTLSVSNTLTNDTIAENLAKNSGANIIGKLKFDNNLPNGQFGGKVTVTAFIGTQYAGKTVYLYYLKPDGTTELIASPVVDSNGNITFDITHCSDYFVTDKLLSAATNTSGTGTSKTTTGTATSSTASSGTSTATATKLVQTGSVIDSTVLISSALVLILVGLTLILIAKKKEA